MNEKRNLQHSAVILNWARYADNPYRMRYDEAVGLLQGMGVDIEWGQDLDYSKEKVLLKISKSLTS